MPRSTLHVCHAELPEGRAATLALVGGELWLVADRRRPDAGEQAAALLREAGAKLLERLDGRRPAVGIPAPGRGPRTGRLCLMGRGPLAEARAAAVAV